MALFCDFENVALGVRDAKYEKFDIKPVLERLLLKGSIVVKKAYCDWDRYKTFKAAMHEASFELIEIPHVRQSGKNSADIRLVVDALDLCYTKSHVDTFVIISGDSDFSPLVSKLRENAKKVIGVGVKNSTSDLLVANCDEFIFYDDLVREQQRAIAKREAREEREAREANEANAKSKRSGDENRQQKHELEARKAQAIAIAVETFDALSSERGESGKIWASVLKSAIKRRKPDFSESYFGFRAFGNLLDEAQARGLLEVGRDEKSGAFVFRASSQGGGEGVRPQAESDGVRAGAKAEQGGKRRKGRGERNQAVAGVEAAGLEAQGDVLEAGHGGNRRKDRDGRRQAPGVVEAVTSQSQDDAETEEHGGNGREDRDAREETPSAAEAVTSQSQSEDGAGEAGVAPQAEPGGNRRKDRRDTRRQAPAVSEAVTPEAQADVQESGAEAHTGQGGNRRKDRHGRGQTPAFVEFVESDETQAAEWFDAVQALGTEAVEVPEAQDDAPFAVEPREPAKASKPAARRGRKTAAKKAAASAEPTVHDTASTAWLFADDEAADEAPPPEAADATPPAEPGKPSRKAARKSAPRARRPRKTAAGSDE